MSKNYACVDFGEISLENVMITRQCDVTLTNIVTFKYDYSTTKI